MVIDKTTGRGCAWSIASKTVVKELVAEGMIDKPIFREYRKNGDDWLRVATYRKNSIYVTRQSCFESLDEPLWTPSPSFIDTEIWAHAVSKFQVYQTLDTNVEKYLLPEMEEYIQNIPDEELISITRDFLIEHGVIYKPISQRRGKTYFFNENEVYSLDVESKLFPYEKRIKFDLFRVRFETCFNMNVWYKAVSQFEVGMTLTECIGVFLKTEIIYRTPQEISPLDRLVQYIAPARYERVPENNNESTFDRIRIIVGLPRYQFHSWEALRDEVKKYRHEIYQRVIQKLEAERQFKKYGVSIHCLKLSDAILLRDCSMEFIFELKDQEIEQQAAALPILPGDDEI